MATIYYDNDAQLELVTEKTVAIIGYGNQGRSQALNMRDSGVKRVIIGSRKDSSYTQANEDGFPVLSIAEAAEQAQILFLLLPDEVAPEVFEEQIRPGLKQGDILNFASGYNITFGKITPPDFVDVVMAAPRMIGSGVRDLFVSGEGFPAFVGVHQDASGKALEYAKALCKAIGSTKKGAIEVTFNDETIMDLMAEQATWPIIYNVFTEIFKLQVEMGHPEEAVLTEMYLSKEPAYMMERAAEDGFFRQLPLHSNTSQYGQLVSYGAVDTSFIRDFVRERYDRIKSGVFAAEWEKEQKENQLSTLNTLKEQAFTSPLTQAEDRLKERLR